MRYSQVTKAGISTGYGPEAFAIPTHTKLVDFSLVIDVSSPIKDEIQDKLALAWTQGLVNRTKADDIHFKLINNSFEPNPGVMGGSNVADADQMRVAAQTNKPRRLPVLLALAVLSY